MNPEKGFWRKMWEGGLSTGEFLARVIKVALVMAIGLGLFFVVSAILVDLAIMLFRGVLVFEGVTTSWAKSAASLVSDISGSSIVQFFVILALMCIVVTIGLTLVARVRAIGDHHNPRTLRECFGGCMEMYRDNNNWIAYVLFFAAVFCTFMAIEHPGPPPTSGIVHDINNALFSERAQKDNARSWDYFLCGDRNLPANADDSVCNHDARAERTSIKEAPAETTWFWGKMALWFWIIFLLSVPFVLHDEFEAGMKSMKRFLQERSARAAAAQQTAQPTGPAAPTAGGIRPPAPGGGFWGNLARFEAMDLSTELVLNLLKHFLGGFIHEHIMQWSD